MLSLINQRVMQKRTKSPHSHLLHDAGCRVDGVSKQAKPSGQRPPKTTQVKHKNSLVLLMLALCISLSCSALVDFFLSCGVSMTPTVPYEHVLIWWAAFCRRNYSRNTTFSKALAASVQWLQQPQWSMANMVNKIQQIKKLSFRNMKIMKHRIPLTSHDKSFTEVSDGRWNFL